jgi:2-oxoglutarate ferredoxin oxidoreductase subunit gamma
VEREVIVTGVGGQGVQLAAQVLARAAVREDRHVMLLGTYGGTMRGGSTDSVVIVSPAPIESPPLVSCAGAAIALHHRFWEPVRARLRPGALAAIDRDVFDAPLDPASLRVLELPASSLAAEAGAPLGAALLLVAAFAGATALVGIESLVEAMREALPPYRARHADANERALRAGYGALPPLAPEAAA